MAVAKIHFHETFTFSFLFFLLLLLLVILMTDYIPHRFGGKCDLACQHVVKCHSWLMIYKSRHYLRRHLNTTTLTLLTVPLRKTWFLILKNCSCQFCEDCDTGHGPDPSGALPSSRRPILWHHRVTVFLFLPEWSHHNDCIIRSYGVTYIYPLTKDKFKERKWQHQHCLFSKPVVSAL